MLIKKLFKVYNKNDFYFVEYFGEPSTISLVVKQNDNDYYDILNHVKVKESQFKHMEPLVAYTNIEEDYITKYKAKKIAKPYYEDFYLWDVDLSEFESFNNIF